MRHRNVWRNLCKYDIKAGTRQIRYRWGFAILFLIFFAVLSCQNAGENRNLWDLLLLLFQGIEPYQRTKMSVFVLPVMLMVHQLLLPFIVGSYAKSDMAGYGRYVLLASKSRWMWWLSKCVWTVLQTVLYYIAPYTVFLAGTMAAGGGTKVEDSIWFGQTKGSELLFLANLIVLPLLTSMFLAIFQLFIGVVTRPVFGYAATIAILIISSYFTTAWLPGNYLMMLRNAYMTGEGMELQVGICLMALFISCGGMWMGRKDILTGGGE